MILEDQVTSLYVSTRLHEAGFCQQSYWHHVYGENGYMGIDWEGGTKTISAYTVSELSKLLPELCCMQKGRWNGLWLVGPLKKTKERRNDFVTGSHLPDVLACFLMDLLEQDELKLSDINLKLAS